MVSKMATQTLVEQLEAEFESPEVARQVKAKTLAGYIIERRCEKNEK